MHEQLSLDFGEGFEATESDAPVSADTILENIFNRLDMIEQNQTPLPDRLWNLKDVATYMRVSEQTARRVLTHHNAPLAVRMPTKRGVKTPPRYVASEIITYCIRKCRDKKA